MALINFISSLAASVRRKKTFGTSGKRERSEPVQVRLVILETNNYFQDLFSK